MPYIFKPISLEVNGEVVEFIKNSDMIVYYGSNNQLTFKIKYYTGNKSSFLGIPVKEKSYIKLTLSKNDFEIKTLVEGDEQTKQFKNLGGGALLGAVIAGPIGAAAGAYLGSMLRECPSIITINEHHIKLNALAPIGYLKEQSKNEFFKNQPD